MAAVNKIFPAFFSGNGKMGERIRNFDWNTAPPDVTLSQRSQFGLDGERNFKLRNHPYKTIVGGKHPQALGKQA
ncbi:hypothetical protein FRZ67_04950 [Panacibacter ginsenosidivorans]|uniref:Uncharacterized protein n=1 Tax=Panacibacter ginsenosidivorans TaxID=1813871 RepID=A0A5B8V660_9BACT|nr:hypothetical protein [Panacibacter ginsenosidivorans]QEC66679.1 hypothetical protein FRZ67_04950 [Panacibacter ginsenosidivorans]